MRESPFVSNSYAKLPNETKYVIDKLVRIRSNQGRYGADYSRVFGIERENKVAKIETEAIRMSSRIEGIRAEKALRDKYADFARRLNYRLEESESRAHSRLSFEEWVEKKDREERLKKRLIEQARFEFEELLRNKVQENIEAAEFDRKVAIESWVARNQGKSFKRSILTDQELEKPFKSFQQWLSFKRKHLL